MNYLAKKERKDLKTIFEDLLQCRNKKSNRFIAKNIEKN